MLVAGVVVNFLMQFNADGTRRHQLCHHLQSK